MAHGWRKHIPVSPFVHDLQHPAVIKLRSQVLNVFSALLFRRAKSQSGLFKVQLFQNEEGKGNLSGV